MKKLIKFIVFLLIVIMLLPYNVMAEEQNNQRLDDLNFLWNTLKEKHPNIFSITTEDKFLSRKAEIQANLDKKTDMEFYLDLSSLMAMVGDSHTNISIGSKNNNLHVLPIKIEMYQGNWILSAVEKKHEALLGQIVVAINNIPITEIARRFKSIISADNEIKLLRQFMGQFYIEEILDYLDIVDSGAVIPVTVKDRDGKVNEFTIKSISALEKLSPDFIVNLSKNRSKAPSTAYDKSKKYKSLPLNDATYYIQYNDCSEDEEIPMDVFSEKVKTDLNKGNYNKILLDLRYNGGGSDGVVRPLLNVLTGEIRQNRTKLYALIGEATFSSAIINAVMVKEAGGVLVGSPTSGSVNHFGSVNRFTLPHSGIKFGISSKFISLSDLLETAKGYGIESLRPDVSVDQTLNDYLSGVDTTVDYLVTNGDNVSLPVNKTEGLTRGRAVEMLYQLAKKDVISFENNTGSFKDVFDFAYYWPAVEWAKENGIIKGKGLTFAPASLITREEFAVMLHNFVKYSKLTPQTKRKTVTFSDENVISTWACDAAKTTYKWGLFNTNSGEFGPKDTLTRIEGESIVQKLIL